MKMNRNDSPSFGIFAGLFFTALATLALEIMLTRIFSVTMWYHFAFLAISVAMFGMSIGAVAIFVKPEWFPQKRLPEILAILSILFAISIPLALIENLYVPFMPIGSFTGLLTVIFTYLVLIVPFGLSGMVVSLVLTRFPTHAGRLYAADLLGAALGCMAVFVLMNIFDGPTAVMAVSVIAAAASIAFLRECKDHSEHFKMSKIRIYVAAALLVLLVVLNAATGIIGIYWTKNGIGLPVPEPNEDIIYERWNPMSRITVHRKVENVPIGWGMSKRWENVKVNVEAHGLFIDNAAGTMLIGFSGDVNKVSFLRDDITSLAYQAMPKNASVAIIGVGGGKDILTAHVFGAKHILGIEINKDILYTLNERFGDFTGHLDQMPEIDFTVDEARSFLSRSKERFDIIQASLIDSWAATASGAFVLTESGLYTVEGWETFLSHLTDRGVVTFSRWWVAWQPGEMLRLTNVAIEALNRMGITDVRNHIFIAAREIPTLPDVSPIGVATLIVSRRPLSESRTNLLEQVCNTLGFSVILSPKHYTRKEFLMLTSKADRKKITTLFPLDITPSTDDDPFFFNMLKPTEAFSHKVQSQIMTQFNIDAVKAVVYLFFALVLLSALLLLLPVVISSKEGTKESSYLEQALAALYFVGIGLGFMLVELGQVHRLSLYLGHPTYSLVVVLMGMLVSAGLGSLSASWIRQRFPSKKVVLVLFLTMIVVLALFVYATPAIVRANASASLLTRLALSFGLVAIPGFFMGMPFPLGLELANHTMPEKLPWLWALNGAFSVLGSVVALILSIGWGITFSMSMGVLSYAVGLVFLAYTAARN